MLRRVRFVPNEAGQIFVAGKDAIHESDVRRGITVEDSDIGHTDDDFFVSTTFCPCAASRLTRTLPAAERSLDAAGRAAMRL